MTQATKRKNKYEVIIEDSFFKKRFTGAFDSVSENGAKTAAKRYYAAELDTVPSDIKIVNCRQIG